MLKEDVLRKIKTGGLVAVVRAQDSEQAIRITEACMAGGVSAIELTFTVPFAHRVIETLAKRYTPKQIILGAGTVLDAETARIAILSGSEYVVTPCLSVETIRMCNRYQKANMAGIMTVTEAVQAMEAGADILKLFPGEVFGPKMIKAIRGPLPYAQLMPTGGVDLTNVTDWIKAGAVALGAGSALTAGEPAKITATAKEFITRIKLARNA